MLERTALLALLLVAPFLFASTAQADCSSENNAVPNCGFEMGDPPENWTSEFGELSQNTSVSHGGSASAEIDGEEDLCSSSTGGPGCSFAAHIRSDCFSVTPAGAYGFGAFFRLLSWAREAPRCWVSFERFTAEGCVNHDGNASSLGVSPHLGSWVLSNASTDTTGIKSARLSIICNTSVFNSFFVVLVDDVFAGPDLVPVDLVSFSIE